MTQQHRQRDTERRDRQDDERRARDALRHCSCGKVTYRSEAAVRKARIAINSRGGRVAFAQYRCNICEGWHLATQTQRLR